MGTEQLGLLILSAYKDSCCFPSELPFASAATARSSPSLINCCTAPEIVSFPSPCTTLFLSCQAFQRIIRIRSLTSSGCGIRSICNQSVPVFRKAGSFGQHRPTSVVSRRQSPVRLPSIHLCKFPSATTVVCPHAHPSRKSYQPIQVLSDFYFS